MGQLKEDLDKLSEELDSLKKRLAVTEGVDASQNEQLEDIFGRIRDLEANTGHDDLSLYAKTEYVDGLFADLLTRLEQLAKFIPFFF